ncbi:MAG: tetratricopeptide repeat protein [Kiritimatiellae bacterium]|nr:tetratricopeptide repeat protein [Kiritimatiellia bacterium]
MHILGLLGIILLIFLLLKVIQVVVIWTRLLSHRFRRPSTRLMADEEMPPDLAPLFNEAGSQLAALGFTPFCAITGEDILANRTQPDRLHIYVHTGTSAYAAVAPPPVPAGRSAFNIEFLTLLPDGNIVSTVNDLMHLMLPNPPRVTTYDHYAPTLAEQWAGHQASVSAAAADQPRPLTPGQFVAELDRWRAEVLDHMIGMGWLVQDAGGEQWRLRIGPAMRTALRFVSGAQKRAVTLKKKGQTSLQPCANDDAVIAANVAAFENLVAFEKTMHQGRLMKGFFLLLTAILFSLAFGFLHNWYMLPALLGILLVHELGHLLGMKLFGYRNRQILFMPFLGAAAMGTKEDATPTQQFVVLLLGPVPGIVLGIICLSLSGVFEAAWLSEVGIMAIAINYINLLPFMPLDGGRIVETLFLSRFPRAQFVLSVVSTAIFLLVYTLTRETIFLILGILFALSLQTRWQSSAAERRVRRILPPGADRRLCLRAIFHVLIHPPFHAQPAPARVASAKALLSHITCAPPRGAAMATGGAIYILLILAPIIVPIAMAIGAVGFHGLRAATSPAGREEHLAQLMAEPDWEARAAEGTTPDERWQVWMEASQWNLWRGSPERARDFAERAVAIRRADPANIASTLTSMQLLAQAYEAAGRADEAETLFHEALALSLSAQGSDMYLAFSPMSAMVEFFIRHGRIEDARAVVSGTPDSMDVHKRPLAAHWMSEMHVRLGWAEIEQGNLDAARKWFEDAHKLSSGIRRFEQVQAWTEVPHVLDMCCVDLRQGKAESARAAVARLRRARARLGLTRISPLKNYCDGLRNVLEAADAEETESDGWARRRMQAHLEVVEQFPAD